MEEVEVEEEAEAEAEEVFSRQACTGSGPPAPCASAPSTAGGAPAGNPSSCRGSPARGGTGTGSPRSPGRTARTCTPGSRPDLDTTTTTTEEEEG